jgi:hypothetical protein
VSTNNHTNSEADQAMENMKAAIIELDKLIAEETDKNTLTELQELKSKLLEALDGLKGDKQDK